MTNINSKGFAALIPVIVVLGILLASLVVKPKNLFNTQAVLPITDYQTDDSQVTDSNTSSNVQESSAQVPTSSPTPTPIPTPTSEVANSDSVVVQFSSDVPSVDLTGSTSNNTTNQTTRTTSPVVPANRTQPTSIVINRAPTSGNFHLNNSVVNFPSNIPLSVNQSTNQLVVSNENGDIALNLSPDLIAETLLNANILSSINNDPSTGRANVSLTLSDEGEPFYEFDGSKTVKLFGIFNVKISKTVQVLASDGSKAKVVISGFDKFIDFLSL